MIDPKNVRLKLTFVRGTDIEIPITEAIFLEKNFGPRAFGMEKKLLEKMATDAAESVVNTKNEINLGAVRKTMLGLMTNGGSLLRVNDKEEQPESRHEEFKVIPTSAIESLALEVLSAE